ncbi:hypothetical protein TRVL_03389 [Trypanosoma vivax]|nr:hypothetical protein TRVL_03389 [Trypanosoma vivax]
MFIDWNVTFMALRKWAMWVNATITTVLQNFGSYKCIDETRARAKEVISGVRETMNTTAVPAAARDFMNETERDFFNLFECIKYRPQMYNFGYSNMNLQSDGRRVSEVLTLFSNFTIFFFFFFFFFAECERAVGEYENINTI